jgi:hypothetical protein
LSKLRWRAVGKVCGNYVSKSCKLAVGRTSPSGREVRVASATVGRVDAPDVPCVFEPM